MKRLAGFAAACLTAIGAALALFLVIVPREEARRGFLIAASLALVVQLATFLVARRMSRTNMIAGWGVGVVMRFVALAVFALVAVPRLGVPVTSTLVAMAVFLFLSTLIEPLFLKP